MDPENGSSGHNLQPRQSSPYSQGHETNETITGHGNVASKIGSQNQGNGNKASEIDPQIQVRYSTGARFSQGHETNITITGNGNVASKIGPQNQGNNNSASKIDPQIQVRDSTGSGFSQGHETNEMIKGNGNVAIKIGPKNQGNGNDASKIDPKIRVRDSTGAGFSQSHETITANHTNASEIGPQNQMITENLENDVKRQQMTRKFKAVASILQGHETITVNTEIDLLNEVRDSTGIGISQGCHEASEAVPPRETTDQTITENLENQVVYLHWPKKKTESDKTKFRGMLQGKQESISQRTLA